MSFHSLKVLEKCLGSLDTNNFVPTLAIDGALHPRVFQSWTIEAIRDDGISSGVLVDVGGPVPDPLTRDEGRQYVVELEFHHLKRSSMAVSGKITNKSPV